MSDKSLYERIGGYDVVVVAVDEILPRLQADAQLGRFWKNRGQDGIARERQLLINYLCSAAGGSMLYTGRDMKLSHVGMKVGDTDWSLFTGHVAAALDHLSVGGPERGELLGFIESLKTILLNAEQRQTCCFGTPMNFISYLKILPGAVSLVFVLFAMPDAQADGPDYEGTIAYIQSGLSGTLTERDQCTFHAKPPASGIEHIFHAGALSVVPIAIASDEIWFECPVGAHCVSALSESPTDKTEIGFAVHSDAHGIALAISRLIELCSGAMH
jgi:hemoglobin